MQENKIKTIGKVVVLVALTLLYFTRYNLLGVFL